MNRSDSLYIGVVVSIFLVTVSVFVLLHPMDSGNDTGTATLAAAPAYDIDVAGERRTVDRDELYTVCPGTDCVPALQPKHTEFVRTEQADTWLDRDDLIAGVSVDGRRIAYPLTILEHHFIVNSFHGTEPVLITYSPYAGHVSAFSRASVQDSDGQPTQFRVTGTLHHGTVIAEDDVTGTHWRGYDGTAVYGSQVPAQLEQNPVTVTRWSLWKDAHPASSVLSHNTSIYPVSRYVDDPFFDYRSSPVVPGGWDDEGVLSAKDMVYGIQTRAGTKAYREVYVKDVELIEDRVGSTPVLIVQDEQTGVIHAFEREVNGSAQSFSLVREGTRLQSQDGTIWTLDGKGVAGSFSDKTLEPLSLTRMYWFAWEQFNPKTDVYRP